MNHLTFEVTEQDFGANVLEASLPVLVELVERKLMEMDVRLRNIKSMKRLLKDITDCSDENLAECIVLTGQRHQVG